MHIDFVADVPIKLKNARKACLINLNILYDVFQ